MNLYLDNENVGVLVEISELEINENGSVSFLKNGTHTIITATYFNQRFVMVDE
jgi:hypothetical protein